MDPYSRKVFSNMKLGAIIVALALAVHGIAQLVKLLLR